jgi:hypothetical protein
MQYSTHNNGARKLINFFHRFIFSLKVFTCPNKLLDVAAMFEVGLWRLDCVCWFLINY